MKSPRDFVLVDELWDADRHWPSYFLGERLWVYCDEYRAELAGDLDYCRIVIHAGGFSGLIFKRPLAERDAVMKVLSLIRQPIAREQLMTLGFSHWQDSYDLADYSSLESPSEVHIRP